jgi:hypothetical protein
MPLVAKSSNALVEKLPLSAWQALIVNSPAAAGEALAPNPPMTAATVRMHQRTLVPLREHSRDMAVAPMTVT